MITLNTNLSSIITKRSLSGASTRLNQAIERMSTGFKINHSSDNAANYSITTNMGVKLSSYEVAQENVETGLDLLTTANDSLDLINDKLIRLRALQEQSMNGTYGTTSLNAINAEVNSLVDEIQRLYDTTEFNGIKLFEGASNEAAVFALDTEILATETTKLKYLGIGDSSFEIYDSAGSLVESYDTEENDKIKDVFEVLKTHGFQTEMKNGVIKIASADGLTIQGELADKLGITSKTETVVQSSTSSSTLEVNEVRTIFTENTSEEIKTITLTSLATEETTFAELGLGTNRECYIKYRGYSSNYGTITVSPTDTIGDFITKLSARTIQAEMTDGRLNLSSTGEYAIYSGDVTDLLGIKYEYTRTVSEVYQQIPQSVFFKTFLPETTNNTTITGCSNFTIGQFMTTVSSVDTSTMIAIADVDTANGYYTKYKVSTPEELLKLTKMSIGNTHIYLENDIDMSGIDWNKSIDTNYLLFYGNGHTISNLTGSASLFKNVSSVSDLGMINVNISTEDSNAGGIASDDIQSISNCFAIGNIKGIYAGGLAGNPIHNGCSISNSYFSGEVIGTEDTGGLAGHIGTQAKISNCYSEGSISSKSGSVGGIVGFASYMGRKNLSSINNVKSTSTITGGENIGGIVGEILGYMFCNTNLTSFDNLYFAGSIITNSTTKTVGSIGGDCKVFTEDFLKNKKLRSDDTSINMFGIAGNYANQNNTISDYGITSGDIKVHLNDGSYETIYVDSTKTFSQLISQLRNYVFISEESLPRFEIRGMGDIYLESVDGGSNFVSYFNKPYKQYDSTSSNSSTASIETSTTIKTTTTVTTTLATTSTLPVTTSTVLKNISGFSNGNGKIEVSKDGEITTVSISETSTVQDLFKKLKPHGITGSVTDGKLTFTSAGDIKLLSSAGGSNLLTVTNIGNVVQTKQEVLNNISQKLKLDTSALNDSDSSGIKLFQVGINAQESSQISVNTSFALPFIEMLRTIGLDNDMDYLELIDYMLSNINAKQTEFGAAQNRLISALDEIETHYENLTSSRSTLRDADIAEVSSQYIKEQILQQASATLMSTANQTPALALQLL